MNERIKELVHEASDFYARKIARDALQQKGE